MIPVSPSSRAIGKTVTVARKEAGYLRSGRMSQSEIPSRARIPIFSPSAPPLEQLEYFQCSCNALAARGSPYLEPFQRCCVTGWRVGWAVAPPAITYPACVETGLAPSPPDEFRGYSNPRFALRKRLTILRTGKRPYNGVFFEVKKKSRLPGPLCGKAAPSRKEFSCFVYIGCS